MQACSTRTSSRKVAAGATGRGRPCGIAVELCRGLGLPRRRLYYRPKARQQVINADLAARVKLALERFPAHGYRRLACVPRENLKPIQRILLLTSGQLLKGP